MEPKQNNIARNIDKFADGLSKNASIDFHIGVTQIFDSVNYGMPWVPTFLPNGTLLPIKNPVLIENDPNGGFLPGRPYITRETPNYIEALRATLKVGVHGKLVDGHVVGGPEDEELFLAGLPRHFLPR